MLKKLIIIKGPPTRTKSSPKKNERSLQQERRVLPGLPCGRQKSTCCILELMFAMLNESYYYHYEQFCNLLKFSLVFLHQALLVKKVDPLNVGLYYYKRSWPATLVPT